MNCGLSIYQVTASSDGKPLLHGFQNNCVLKHNLDSRASFTEFQIIQIKRALELIEYFNDTDKLSF